MPTPSPEALLTRSRLNPPRRWIQTLLPLGLAVTLSLPGDQTLYAVLPTRAATVGISLGAVGILLGVNRLIRIPGNPLVGMLYDRFGRRRLFLLGLGLGMVSTALYGLTYGFWPFLGGRLLWGLAWSLINVGGYTMILDLSDDADRGRSIGLYQVSYLVGLFFSPMLGGFLADTWGFRPALLVCAAFSGVGLGLAWLGLPETSKVAARKQAARLHAERGAQESPSAPTAGRRSNRQMLVAGYLYLINFFASNGILMSTISLYLGERFGERIRLAGLTWGTASLGGLMLALRSLAAMLAGPTAGYLSDRRGERWTVIVGGLLLGATGFLVLVWSGSLVWLVLGVVIVALGSGALITALAALVGDSTTVERQGRVVGRLATAGDVGSAAGPLLAYGLVLFVDLRWVYLFCALVFLSGLGAVRGLRSNGEAGG